VKSLEDFIQEAGGPIKMLRSRKDDCGGPASMDPPLIVPQIPYQFSSWEREIRSWRETVALFDQTHHMEGVFVSGPDALKFLSQLACNKLSDSTPNRAHQIVCCGEDGYLIGDAILFHLEVNHLSIYGAPYIHDWIEYQAANSKFDVKVKRDERSPVYANGYGNTRPDCRYQIQGPNAGKLIEKLNGGPISVKFFHITNMTIGGHKVRALRHGMAGAPGLEVCGPWEVRTQIRDAIIEAGEEFGLVKVGAHAYLTATTESGWIPSIVPAIYNSDSMKDYRKWLPWNHQEGVSRLSGSYYSDKVEDYYRTPFDQGYGHIVNFEHDFIGRDALQKLSETSSLKKVTIAWNIEDSSKLFAEMLTPGGSNCKMIHLPHMEEAEFHYDKLTIDDTMIGTTHCTAYNPNERSILSLAMVDKRVEIGEEVVLHWGEAGGGYGNRIFPATDIFKIRGIVSPVPYSRVAREEYAGARGWRARA
jgi:vanillate/3-O-methylgallate O-demethylase